MWGQQVVVGSKDGEAYGAGIQKGHAYQEELCKTHGAEWQCHDLGEVAQQVAPAAPTEPVDGWMGTAIRMGRKSNLSRMMVCTGPQLVRWAFYVTPLARRTATTEPLGSALPSCASARPTLNLNPQPIAIANRCHSLGPPLRTLLSSCPLLCLTHSLLL